MPTRAFTAADIDDSGFLLDAAHVFMSLGDSDAEDIAGLLLLAAADPFMKVMRQDVGIERLSLERLNREATSRGVGGNVVSHNVYDRFGFHLEHLATVVHVLDVPARVKVKRDTFTGEECVLLLLRRLRTTGSLLSLTKETGRYTGQISLACNWAVRFIRRR